MNELFQEFLLIAQLLDIGPDALELQQAYIAEGTLTETWYDDALHVALATVAECNIIGSESGTASDYCYRKSGDNTILTI